MLSKLQKVRQSMSDLTTAATNALGQRINELQQLPAEIPESWDERNDDNGNPYYVDTETGEWYRLVDNNAKKHKRIDTNEKLSIITAESQKEFDEHKKEIDAEQSDDLNTTDDDDEERHDEVHESIKQTLTNGAHSNSKDKTKHSKRSSTSVSKGWQCEKCTLENKGHDMKCNACLAPRPYVDDDEEEEDALSNVDEQSDEKDEFVKVDAANGNGAAAAPDEDDGTRGRAETAHRTMDTMEAIQSALDASLEVLGDSSVVKTLSAEQKNKLITFMDFVDTEPDPSVKYLNDANWDIETAVEAYFRQHPDHPKSRGGSLVFDLKQLGVINQQDMDMDMVDYSQDITLPPDIDPNSHGHEQGRRGSQELDEVPNGVRSIDNEDGDDANNNGSSNSEEHEHDFHVVPLTHQVPSDDDEVDGHTSPDDEDIAYRQTGNRSEHPVHNPREDVDEVDAYAVHNRMDTAQQIGIAEQMSLQQSEFDGQLDQVRQDNETLNMRVAELERENEELKIENTKYAAQVKEVHTVQEDWSRMTDFMTQILAEVHRIEEERQNGRDISTPTPQLKAIFEQIEGKLANGKTAAMEMAIKDRDDDADIYKHVADLFDENTPNNGTGTGDGNDYGMHLNVDGGDDETQQQQHRPRKLSFGLVNELFAPHEPNEFAAPMQTQTQRTDALSSSSASNSASASLANSFLEVATQPEHDKRLSYGGVGLLFNGNATSSAPHEDDHNNDDDHEDEHDDDDDMSGSNPLNVSFAPSYQGIASLFDEHNDVLAVHAHPTGVNKRNPSFGGDLVELFTEPNPEWIPKDALSNVDEELEVEEEAEQQPQLMQQGTVVETTNADEEEEEADSMDEQHFYPDADDEDDDDDDEDDDEQDDDDDDDDRFEADKTPKDDVDKDAGHLHPDSKLSTHERFQSYNSNASAGDNKRHSRNASFALKDIFKDNDESESENAPSVASAPEEHDYYAITAYYGIDDEDAGWESRRSSLFGGDYGQIHSRRTSKRVQETNEQMQQLFEVDLTAKKPKEADNVADLFADADKTKEAKYKITTTTIVEEDDDHDMDMDVSGSGVDKPDNVADLFDDTPTAGDDGGNRRPTYTGVQALFGDDNDGSAEDDGDEDEDMDDKAFENMRLNNGVQNKNVPRPSTMVALGSTFDSIATLKVRALPNDNTSAAVEDPREEDRDIDMRDSGGHGGDDLEQRIRQQEEAKLSQMQRELQQNYESKLADARTQIEQTTDERVRKELLQTLRAQIESESHGELQQQYDVKEQQMQQRLNTLEHALTDKTGELQQSFESQLQTLKNEMDEREQNHQQQLQLVQQSKFQLIEHTAKEIDALRSIIKKYGYAAQFLTENTHKNSQNANKGSWIGFLQ